MMSILGNALASQGLYQTTLESDQVPDAQTPEFTDIVVEGGESETLDELERASEVAATLENIATDMRGVLDQNGGYTLREFAYAVDRANRECSLLGLPGLTTATLEELSDPTAMTAQCKLTVEALENTAGKIDTAVGQSVLAILESNDKRWKGLFEKNAEQTKASKTFLGGLFRSKWNEEATYQVPAEIVAVVGEWAEQPSKLAQAVFQEARTCFYVRDSLWIDFWKDLEKFDGHYSDIRHLHRAIIPESVTNTLPGNPRCSKDTDYKVVFGDIKGVDKDYTLRVGDRKKIEEVLSYTGDVNTIFKGFEELYHHYRKYATTIADTVEAHLGKMGDPKEGDSHDLVIRESWKGIIALMRSNVAFFTDMAAYLVKTNGAVIKQMEYAFNVGKNTSSK